ncbi:hypothetical protein [Sphingobium sp. TCM1]|uniref:hypothetical protein n=1 Tax=Sphingobium sp. TCM1 TaxID=453246 RepID=UPI000AA31682|nr:hypothetical protein [Sphingobium sp. TCM1]
MTVLPGTVLVVGGAGGIGSAICRRLGAEWQRVAVGYCHNAVGAASVAREIGGAVPVASTCATGQALRRRWLPSPIWPASSSPAAMRSNSRWWPTRPTINGAM